jgi:UDP-N-acetylglucosamine--N-acetylmuramyl-(pentapeptide) pyrophosphoryl-undecaprenol N-acetylglucosamine transferase
MTILLAGGGTGGHVFPLIAVADAMKRLEPEMRVVFVGTERGIEKHAVPARGYQLELMRVLPIRGKGVRGAVRGLARAFASIPEAGALLRRHRPRAVCSIGGYAAGPISLAARARAIPLALIEPNSVMGLTNRLIAPFVQRGYTAFDKTDAHFKRGAVRKLGVPLRNGFRPRPYRRSAGPLSLLVLGGSQGAAALNETVPVAVARSGAAARVVHQVGRDAEAEAKVRELYRGLGLQDVEVSGFIEDVPAALEAAELVIGRAGASAIGEICAIGRPSLLIPYPFAADDHQLENARALAGRGAAVCLPAREATAERIASEIKGLMEGNRLNDMAERARQCGHPDAARAIAEDLLDLSRAVPPSDKRSAA